MIRPTGLVRIAPALLALAVAAAPASLAQHPIDKSLILATTTSTQDSGLLDALVPIFEKKAGYRVKTIAVGSGQALTLGRRGEADVLLVHAPDAEEKFMAEGCGLRRRPVMHNDFVLVGPEDDSAGGRRAKSASEAFEKIASAGAVFFSRGDESGTHVMEKKLWKAAAVAPEGRRWYRQTGLGMGETLNVAAEKKGYALTDRGTYLALKKRLGLPILFEGDKSLLNVYHVIEVNGSKVDGKGARAFADFMVAAETQQRIRTFGVEQHGQPLFFPDALPKPGKRGPARK